MGNYKNDINYRNYKTGRKNEMNTIGLIVGNRGFFPSELCAEGRQRVIIVLKKEGFNIIALSKESTHYGTVESYQDAKKCAEIFKRYKDIIDGILITLPNFSDERGITDCIRLSGLNVPILVHAFPEEINNMSIKNRRDSFCGKISVCNNLKQYGITFSLTKQHTIDPESDDFRKELHNFGALCRVVNGLKKARFGQVGARPAAFSTVRYSEKLLERMGISVETIDLSEILGRISKINNDDIKVKNMSNKLKEYVNTHGIPEIAILKMAKFAIVIEDFINEKELVGTAIQCWTALEEYLGIAPCAAMSMMSNTLIPSACEADIMGLVSMSAMVLASGKPSALLDWNNNYGNDQDKAIVFHCSNIPKDILKEDVSMHYQEIIAGTVGKDNAYGTIVGQIKPHKITYCRVSTDDNCGKIRAYLGEGEIVNNRVDTFGGYGVLKILKLQKLLRYICEEGFEHHVAINISQVADILAEAFEKYLGWDVYYHKE